MKNKILLLVIVAVCGMTSLLKAQTPPARTWYYNDYGRKTTVKERWDENSNGLKNGKYIYYYTNGERKTLGNFSNGKKNGKWIDENCYEVFLSQICRTTLSTYKNDVLDGEYKVMTNANNMFEALLSGGKMNEYDGKYSTIGQYTNGNRTGYWKIGYDEETKVYQEGYYSSNGNIKGKWINTYCEGKGTKVKKGYTTYFDNEGKFIKCISPEGISTIEEIAFNRASSIKSLEEFLNDYPNSKLKNKAQLKINELKNNKIKEEWSEILQLVQEVDTLKLTSSLTEFISSYPNNNRILKAKELQSELKYFKELVGDGTYIKVYSLLIEKFPNGILSTILQGKRYNLKPEYSHVPLNFNTDSYILTSQSEKNLIKFCMLVNDWNTYMPNDKVFRTYTIVAQTAPSDNPSSLSQSDKVMFYKMAKNRAYIIKSLMMKYISDVEVKILASSYLLSDELSEEYGGESGSSFVLSGNKIEKYKNKCEKLALEQGDSFNDDGNLITRIIINTELRKIILYNMKGYSKVGRASRTIPIELWAVKGAYGLGLEEDFDTFQKKIYKIIKRSKYEMKLSDYNHKYR